MYRCIVVRICKTRERNEECVCNESVCVCYRETTYERDERLRWGCLYARVGNGMRGYASERVFCARNTIGGDEVCVWEMRYFAEDEGETAAMGVIGGRRSQGRARGSM